MLVKIAAWFVFLVLTSEPDFMFEQHWSTPMHYVEVVLFAPIPGVRLPVMDGIVLFLLLAARGGKGAKLRARPMDTAFYASLGTVALTAIWDLSRGGRVLDMRLQLHAFVFLIITGFAFTNVFRTTNDFYVVGRAILYENRPS